MADGVQLELFARAVLEKAGCEVPSAEAVAWSLTEGSLRGVDSHGAYPPPLTVRGLSCGCVPPPLSPGIRLLPHYVEVRECREWRCGVGLGTIKCGGVEPGPRRHQREAQHDLVLDLPCLRGA